jgi:hypothetical protein
MSFLPQNYEPPATGNYCKLQNGDNKLRILGPAIVGNEFWTTDSKGGRTPVRRRVNEQIADHELGINPETGKREVVKHFWAVPVWNYKTNQVQVWQINQARIRDSLMSLNQSDDWGNPADYDLNIKRTGSGLDTEYAVLPSPKRPITQQVADAFLAASIDLEKLFDAGDPFSGNGHGSNGQGGGNTQPPEAVEQTTTTLIQAVEQKTDRTGAAVFIIKTADGEFGTRDTTIGKRVTEYAGQSRKLILRWKVNGKGGKSLTGWSVAATAPTQSSDIHSHEALSEEEIPF